MDRLTASLQDIPERYRASIRVVGECWEWTGTRLPAGYGRLGRGYAHREIYRMLVGPIPDGLTLDHLCKNPPCVRPAHLEPVSLRENILRGDGPGTARRAERIATGACYDCGAPAAENRTRCTPCLATRTTYQQRWARATHYVRPERRRLNGA